MNDMEFKPGDLVRLKSGGPVMTVSIIETDGLVRCVWFDSEWQLGTNTQNPPMGFVSAAIPFIVYKRLQNEYFKPEVLIKAN